MSSLKDVLVCKFDGCNQVYNDPRFLPCGNRTCAAHVDKMMVNSNYDINFDARKMIKCHFCEEMHSFPKNAKGFPVDENIPLLLNINYGKEHSAAKKCFSEVTQLIDKLTNIDKEGFVIDYFERVEADIELEKEVNVQKLLAFYQKLVDEVHERKVKCLHNLKTNKALESELDTIKQRLAVHESQLKRENLEFIIKTLDGDEDKWKAIQSECAALLKKVKTLEDQLKNGIIGDQMTHFKPSTHDTTFQGVCGNLDQVTIDSTILTTVKMKKDLIELCKLSGKQFKLLYRATIDGFAAVDFHDKCDNQPGTLTIIKVKNGNIFGGFTSVAWDSSNYYKADPHAFLFSLVNFVSESQLMPIKVGDKHSIYCNSLYGPTFGIGHDLHISNYSNATYSSYSVLNFSYSFTSTVFGSNETQSFLAGSH